MPAAYQNETEPLPEGAANIIPAKEEMPETSQRHTEIMPDSEHSLQCSNQPQPAASRIDTESLPTVLSAKTDILSGFPKKPLSTKPAPISNPSEPDRYFDQLEAWDKFAVAWGREIENDAPAREWFFKEIVNANLFGRLVRAAERYLASLAPGWEPISAFYWFGQWTAWEDQAPVKK